ncbi:MAG: macro domain-containing protein [Candidatus Bathyarchaeota archaeon]|nr:macro domain-containing protein [Candidatus Bathyarchaeota archaeon]
MQDSREWSSLQVKIGETILELVRGDITELCVDSIVNAANGALRLGGGVAGAIRKKGGSEIQTECNGIIAKKGRIPTGEAAITTGGNLTANHVIHAVGPVHGEGDEDKKLRNATISSLKLADQHHLKSIAFPAISTGHFGLPKKRSAEAMLPAAISYIKRGTNLKYVVFCLYDQETFHIFKEALKHHLT